MADIVSCKSLAKINNEVKQVYLPGIEFEFIFATLHGLHNGIGRESINSYTKEMEKIFKKFGFKFVYLDPLWEKYGINFGKVDTIFRQKLKGWWNEIENTKIIENNAKKRNKRLSPQIVAQKYYIMRDLEKEMLEKNLLILYFIPSLTRD